MRHPVRHFELSEGEAVLTFVPHLSGDEATFDVTTANRACLAESHLDPECQRRGPRICSNIDRAAGRLLHAALTAWLADSKEPTPCPE